MKRESRKMKQPAVRLGKPDPVGVPPYWRLAGRGHTPGSGTGLSGGPVAVDEDEFRRVVRAVREVHDCPESILACS